MAKDWAYAFYHSTSWDQCRAGFMQSRYWLCERCGSPALIAHHKTHLTPGNINDPNVTLNWDNLEAVCQDCHNKEHFETVTATRSGFAFDVNGDLIQA